MYSENGAVQEAEASLLDLKVLIIDFLSYDGHSSLLNEFIIIAVCKSMSHQPGGDRIIIVFPRNSVCTKCRDSGQQSAGPGLMKTSKVRVNNSNDTTRGGGEVDDVTTNH